MNDLIFPAAAALKIEDIEKVGQHIDIYALSTRPEVSCPDCQTVSPSVHGRYWRHPQDLPCLGLTVRLHLEVRRFACHNAGCSRKTFAEDLNELLACRARRTSRLRDQHLAVAYALGGEAGKRLAHGLGMPISGDTLIRDIRRLRRSQFRQCEWLGLMIGPCSRAIAMGRFWLIWKNTAL